MTLSLIVAMSRNNIIGKDNALPWHLPADLKYFKAVTMGKPIVMGRKTFDSIGRPLPGRRNLVLTRNTAWSADGVEVFPSLDHARDALGGIDAMIIGGAEIYRQALSHVDRLYVTEVDVTTGGDAVFPDIDPTVWAEVSRESHAAGTDTPAYSFVVYDRN